MAHGISNPGVFELGCIDSEKPFCGFGKLPVHMAWPGAAKERMSIQRLGGTVGPDYEWHWPGQI